MAGGRSVTKGRKNIEKPFLLHCDLKDLDEIIIGKATSCRLQTSEGKHRMQGHKTEGMQPHIMVREAAPSSGYQRKKNCDCSATELQICNLLPLSLISQQTSLKENCWT